MTKKKFIVWDWNGTLLDDTHIVLDCFNIALKHFSVAPVSREAFLNIQGPCMKSLYRKAGVPEHKLDEIVELERDIFHDNYENQSHTAGLRNGAKRVLEHLASNEVTSVILSNHINTEIARLLRHHEIFHHFDDILAYKNRETQFREKDKKGRLIDYTKDKDLGSGNTLIVGDSTEEIGVGHELGIESVAVTGGMTSEDRLRAAKPDYLIHELAELAPILKKRGFVA
jgi:phosphoglycolate phosphatase